MRRFRKQRSAEIGDCFDAVEFQRSIGAGETT
jgi:hypothetical protein